MRFPFLAAILFLRSSPKPPMSIFPIAICAWLFFKVIDLLWDNPESQRKGSHISSNVNKKNAPLNTEEAQNRLESRVRTPHNPKQAFTTFALTL